MADEEILEEIEEIEEPEVDEATLAAEAQAKVLGWRPKEEFVGDPDKWRDAKEFLQHGQDTLPILRENNKRLIKDMQELKQTFKEFTEHHKKTVKVTAERAYEKALRDIKEEQRKAVADGDVEKWDELERAKESIQPPDDIDIPEPAATPAKDPAFAAWEKENSWYGGDTTKELSMTARAEQLAAVLQNKGYPLDKMLEKVTECIKEEYPDHFKNKRAQSDASVSTPTRGAQMNSGKKGKSYNDLPEDAKKECDKYVKQGFDQKQYLEDYFGEE